MGVNAGEIRGFCNDVTKVMLILLRNKYFVKKVRNLINAECRIAIWVGKGSDGCQMLFQRSDCFGVGDEPECVSGKECQRGVWREVFAIAHHADE